MPSQPFSPQSLQDAISDFLAGVNSGVSPLKLNKETLADARNVTVRGTFATHRPPWRKIALSYGPISKNFVPGTAAPQVVVEQGTYQGGAYFDPDIGNEAVMAQISGRLFQFTPDVLGNAVVTERTITGDPNPADRAQAWLWQAESWMIVNDGISLPIFVDSATSRRSTGAATSVGTVDGAGFIPPAVGGTVAATLTAPYTGSLNITVSIDDALYSIVGITGADPGYAFNIRNDWDSGAATIPVGTVVQLDTTFVGYIPAAGTLFAGVQTGPFTLDRNVPTTVQLGSTLKFNGAYPATVTGATPAGTFFYVTYNGPSNVALPANTKVTLASGAVIPLGTIAKAFTDPVLGGTTQVQLSQNFTGPFPSSILIGGNAYTLASAGPAPGANVGITIQNINDTPGGPATHKNSSVMTLAEMLPGRMGAYGLGRNWYSLPDEISYRATDIVGSSSGSLAYQFRDAVLKEERNTFLTGGDFRIPGQGISIRGMAFVAILDTSLGQGPLQVLTPNVVFSCNAPVDDKTWQSLTNPIQTETLKPKGGLGQWSSVTANSDLLFRAPDGLRSEIFGQRQFATWGNTSQSREVSPTLDADNDSLLNYSSAVNFNNRLILTANPVQGPNGVFHDTQVAINFDPVSSLNGKGPSVWDGVWTPPAGITVLQLFVGQFYQKERCFAFCFNSATLKNEFWEILKDDAATEDSSGPIVWEIQSASLFNYGKDDPKSKLLKQLEDGEIRVDNLIGTVQFEAFYKPDQWPNWIPWHSWSETQDPTLTPSFRPRMGLGQPSDAAVDNYNNRLLREFYTVQFKLVVTGHCRFLGANFAASTVPQPQYALPK